MSAPFSFAEAERLLGPAVIEIARRNVEAAPPIGPELRERIRAVFATARPARRVPAAKPTAAAA